MSTVNEAWAVHVSRDNAHCPLFYSMGRDLPPLGTDAMLYQWSQGSAQPAAEDPLGGGLHDVGGTRLGPHDMVLVGDTTPGWDIMETSSPPGPCFIPSLRSSISGPGPLEGWSIIHGAHKLVGSDPAECLSPIDKGDILLSLGDVCVMVHH